MKRHKNRTKIARNDTQKQPNDRRVRVGRLQSLGEVASLQARIIKSSMKGGGSATNDGYKLVLMASCLAKVLETSNLEKRIAALEQKFTLLNS